MRYAEISGRVFSRKNDYLNAVVRACARKLHFLYKASLEQFISSFLFVNINI